MHAFAPIAAAALAALPAVSAHGYVSSVTSGGKSYSGMGPNWIYGSKPSIAAWYAKDQDLGYVAPSAFGTSDIVCHKSATPGETYVPVTAGSTIQLHWSTWPTSHHGPVLTYMARCKNNDCTNVDPTSLNFFKIEEAGLKDGNVAQGKWATDDLIASNSVWSVKIPSDVAPGNFVLRHEIIALHSADVMNGAQAYPQCINIEVTGSGTRHPCLEGGDCRPGTKLYHANGPGIFFNIWRTFSSYPIPGPAVWSGLSSKAKRVAQTFAA